MHFNYFSDRASGKMKVYIDSCFKYNYFTENSFKYEYSNGLVYGIKNFIKL